MHITFIENSAHFPRAGSGVRKDAFLIFAPSQILATSHYSNSLRIAPKLLQFGQKEMTKQREKDNFNTSNYISYHFSHENK